MYKIIYCKVDSQLTIDQEYYKIYILRFTTRMRFLYSSRLPKLHLEMWYPLACVFVTQACQTLCDPMETVAHKAPLSMEFSRQEYWVGCHALLQRIFLTQGLNLGLPPYRQTLHHLNHQGSPIQWHHYIKPKKKKKEKKSRTVIAGLHAQSVLRATTSSS